MTSQRSSDTDSFYALLAALAGRVGGPRELRTCSGGSGWPKRGVYFFFEQGETRPDATARVVRVGTHGLTASSRSTLWHRLRQHRGPTSGSGAGNHRGSIFRHHLGSALVNRHPDKYPSGMLAAWLGTRSDPHMARHEVQLEREVTAYLGRMPVLWVAVDTPTDRATVESNAIALLSRVSGATDRPSTSWLGHYAANERVRRSGLWNDRHVDEAYARSFLTLFARLVHANPTT